MTTKLKFETTNAPIEMIDIENFEREGQLKLPNDYKTFLLQHNGGELTSGQVLPCPKEITNDSKLPLMNLYGIENKDADSLSDGLHFWRQYYLNGDNLPDYMFVFADCLAPTIRIIMSIADIDYGYVYLWDREMPFSREYSYLVAKSFDGFVGQIFEEDREKALNDFRELMARLRSEDTSENS